MLCDFTAGGGDAESSFVLRKKKVIKPDVFAFHQFESFVVNSQFEQNCFTQPL